MRKLEHGEINIVSGGTLQYGNCFYQVSSEGIPLNEFTIIETETQMFYDGKKSAEDALMSMLLVGVSADSIFTYYDNFPNDTSYCM